MKFEDIVPYVAGDTVVVLRTEEEHIVLEVKALPDAEEYCYLLDNGTNYYHHELKKKE